MQKFCKPKSISDSWTILYQVFSNEADSNLFMSSQTSFKVFYGKSWRTQGINDNVTLIMPQLCYEYIRQ